MAEFPEVGVDVERANAARMYDYFLGGAHHFAIDREHADRVIAENPGTVTAARANRAFLARVVRWCVEAGIDQFLDLGSGVPTVGNVHEIAHGLAPRARVAYVDVEPVAVAHAENVVAELDTVTVTRADLRSPSAVLEAPGVAGLLDLERPVALLALAVLHFVPGDLRETLNGYRAVLAPGSIVAVSHVSDDQDDHEVGARMRAGCEAYRGTANEITLRTRAELYALLDGLELVPPGLVDATRWPVERDGVSPVGGYGVVATVPGTGDPEPRNG